MTLTILFAVLATALAAAPAAAGAPQRLLAPASACPDQANPAAPAAKQVRAMRCLVDFARRSRGLPAYVASRVLDRAAAHKSADILRCGDFSHEACGRPFTYCSGTLEGYAGAPRLDSGLRQPRLLRRAAAPRMAPCPMLSTSPTATASWRPS